MFNFEKLEIWRVAINFADWIYGLTRTFPEMERFGLIIQMRRAAVSVSFNLAEGSSRSSRSDFARFVEIATGSLFEIISQATISRRQGFIFRCGIQTTLRRLRETEQNAERTEKIVT